MKKYIGIDIGGTAVKVGLVTEDGSLLATVTESVNFDHYRTPIIQTVLKTVDRFLSAENLSVSGLSGFGVSATGQIDSREGVVAGTAGHIPNWLGTPIARIFREKYGLPVAVVNDADCALMGEHWLGAARGYRDVVMITVGTGVGGGILCGGRLLTGARGIAGELGHFSIRADGEACTCGSRGCYERYASASALVRKVREQARELFPELSADETEKINGKRIFDKVNAGDPLLTAVVNGWIGDIACGLTGLIHIFNPELVLIGGGVSRQEDAFIRPLRERVLASVMPGFREGLKIQAAALGNEAGILGAAACIAEFPAD